MSPIQAVVAGLSDAELKEAVTGLSRHGDGENVTEGALVRVVVAVEREVGEGSAAYGIAQFALLQEAAYRYAGVVTAKG